MKRIVLGIQYDGASWHGWQTQPDRHTVQDRLEQALREFTQQPHPTVCAGRTDRGVHALEQVVHFDSVLEREMFSWVRGLNALLPPSIAVRWAHSLEADVAQPFHARFSARDRTYRYLLYNHPVRSPMLVGRAGWTFQPLAVEAMQVAADHLLGTHDFSAFRSSECQAPSPIRTLHELRIERQGHSLVFTLRANAFLHHMVRNIVGSLVAVGNGKRPPEWLQQLLQERDRSRAAPTFMPDGLYLAKVDYDAKWGLPQEDFELPGD
ncbi:MAG TPA: tRNA pseudouridine(38-40) synthase TruA [Burkholderiaceae bacterium]|nr:tRNA pseudouridine(38-40) synthase TruA [Burkholderiaceae bacterium]